MMPRLKLPYSSSYPSSTLPRLILLLLLLSLLTCPLQATTTPSCHPNNATNPAPLIHQSVSLALATSVLSAALAAASAQQIRDNIAVVDPSGLLVAFARMDGAFRGGVDLAIKKARTVVLFGGLESAALYPAVLPNGSLYGMEETNGGLVVFPGGAPLYKDGSLLGAVGVSGGTVAQDAYIAQVAAEWLAGL